MFEDNYHNLNGSSAHEAVPTLIAGIVSIIVGVSFLYSSFNNDLAMSDLTNLEFGVMMTPLLTGILIIIFCVWKMNKDNQKKLELIKRLTTTRTIGIDTQQKILNIKTIGYDNMDETYTWDIIKKIEIEKREVYPSWEWGLTFVFDDSVENLWRYSEQDCRQIRDTIREILRNDEDNPINI